MEAASIESENVVELCPLVPPDELRRRLPVGDRAGEVVRRSRAAVRDAIHGRGKRRLLVIVGPCSIHDPAAALDYAERLRAVADATRGDLVIVMRAYLEKPRTTIGWKGLINDPTLDGSCDVATGLEIGRRTLVAINELGVPCGSEIVDPSMAAYLADLLSWASIGARTSQSQTHREMASALDVPVGIKNGVDGDVAGAVNGVVAAARPQTLVALGRDGFPAIVRTRGNPDGHVVLRGGTSGPNYGVSDVRRVSALLAAAGRPPRVLVDCSHGNSDKDHRQQPMVLRELLARIREGDDRLLGFLVESHLAAGRQSWQPGTPLRYGVSITDACIGWDDTESLLREAAEVVARAKKEPGP